MPVREGVIQVSSATIKETPAHARNRFKVAIKQAMAEIKKWEQAVGELLTEAKAYFKDDAVFFLWAEEATGRKQAMVYRYMQAAAVALDCPEAAAVTRSVESLAALDRVPSENRKAVVTEAKRIAREAGDKSVTGLHFKAAAVKVVPAEAVKAEAKQADEKVEADRLQGAVERKLAAPFSTAIDSILIQATDDAILTEAMQAIVTEAIILGLVKGCDLGAKHGGLTGKAAKIVAANYRANEAKADEAEANPLHNATEEELALGAEALAAEAEKQAKADMAEEAKRAEILDRREKMAEARVARQEALKAAAEAKAKAEKAEARKAAAEAKKQAKAGK
jgi:colicin import membrane protein